jgi:hypothetical protein
MQFQLSRQWRLDLVDGALIMSHILEQAVANFEARPRHKIAVPEWSKAEGPMVEVWFKTPNAKVLSKVQKEASGDPIEQAARMVALVATDENGKRLFSEADYSELMIRTDPRGISRIYAAIISDARLDVHAAEKN